MFQQPLSTELYMALTPDALASPVSIHELNQLVQMRVPEAEILRDLENRALLSPLDGASERSLLRDGASLSLVRRLRTFMA
jgi:hypothetical protein